MTITLTKRGFFNKLEIPPGIMPWIETHAPNTPFILIADKETGKFAGAVRKSALIDYLASLSAEERADLLPLQWRTEEK